MTAACGYRGEVLLLLPRRALHLCAPDDGRLRARITGRLFQGEHLSLQLTLADGSALKLHALHAPERGGHLAIEAGTGVGKSFAYLVPAVLHAKRTRRKAVVSTHTIALQEQLVYKDIPLRMKVCRECALLQGLWDKVYR